jgi:hypothetical protein
MTPARIANGMPYGNASHFMPTPGFGWRCLQRWQMPPEGSPFFSIGVSALTGAM